MVLQNLGSVGFVAAAENADVSLITMESDGGLDEDCGNYAILADARRPDLWYHVESHLQSAVFEVRRIDSRSAILSIHGK